MGDLFPRDRLSEITESFSNGSLMTSLTFENGVDFSEIELIDSEKKEVEHKSFLVEILTKYNVDVGKKFYTSARVRTHPNGGVFLTKTEKTSDSRQMAYTNHLELVKKFKWAYLVNPHVY